MIPISMAAIMPESTGMVKRAEFDQEFGFYSFRLKSL